MTFLKSRNFFIVLLTGVALISVFWGDIIIGNSVLFDQDILTEYVPLQTFVSTALSEGGKGWWNPYAAMGTPLLADGHAGIYYIPAMIYRLIGADPSHLGIYLAIHLLYCFVFTCLFAREMGVGRHASLLAGIVCTFSGYQTAIVSTFLYALSITHTPALFYFLTKLLKSSKIKFAIVLGLVFSQQFCIGYFPFSFNTLIALFVFCCFSADWHVWKKWTGPLAISAISAIVFSLPQLLPTLEFIPLSSFENGVKYDYMVSNSMTPKLLLYYFFPHIWNKIPLESSDTEMGVFDFDELHNYLGLLPLFFVFLALTYPKNKFQRSLLILGCITFILSLGKWAFGLYHLLAYVPGFNFFKDPMKWIVHTNLMLVVFAALGLESFLCFPMKTHTKKFFFFLIPISLALGCYLVLPEFKTVALQFAAVLVFSLVLLFLPVKKSFKLGSILVFIFAELFYFESRFIPKEKPDYYETTKWHIDVLKETSHQYRAVDGIFQNEQEVWKIDHLLADLGTFHKIPTLTVTSPFVTKAWSHMRDWAEAKGMEDLQRFRSQESLSDLIPFLEALNVGKVIEHEWQLLELSHVRPRAYVTFQPQESSEPLKTFLAGCGEGKCPEAVLTETFNLKSEKQLIPAEVKFIHSEKVLITVESETPGLLVYQDQFYPGWKALVNGVEKPILKVNGIFKAVNIDKPGRSEVEFLFRPNLYVWMEYFFWICWLGILPMMVVYLFNASRKSSCKL